MAPPPGLFSMMTGWPRLSDNFCPNTRAMMSLPPPAVKPTMMWIGRAGYFAASSAANAIEANAISARQLAIDNLPRKTFMNLLSSKLRDVNMQHRGLAVIQCREAAIDRGREIIRLGDAFAVSAERPRYAREITLLALAARGQPGLKLVGLGGDAVGVNALHRRFHRLPAAIVEHHRQNRNL